MKNRNITLFLVGIVLGLGQFPSKYHTYFLHFLQTGNMSNILLGGNATTIDICNLLGHSILVVDTIVIVFIFFLGEIIYSTWKNR